MSVNVKKDVNCSTVHNANQIMQLVKYVAPSFIEDFTPESVKSLELLNRAFGLANHKLHPCFGNNLAKTNFPSFTNNVISKYVEGNLSNLDINAFLNVLALSWNLTDSSELFCKYLTDCKELKDNIVNILCTKEYNEENKIVIEAALSIINNVSRRDSLKDSFKSYDICDKILQLRKKSLMTRDFQIICVAIIYYIAPSVDLTLYAKLGNEIRNDIIEIIDAASNVENYNAEGFTLKELLEILTVISRDQNNKEECGKNKTLLFTLVRVLSKQYHPEYVIRLAKAIYNKDQFIHFRQTYVEKYGESNITILDLLKLDL